MKDPADTLTSRVRKSKNVLHGGDERLFGMYANKESTASGVAEGGGGG